MAWVLLRLEFQAWLLASPLPSLRLSFLSSETASDCTAGAGSSASLCPALARGQQGHTGRSSLGSMSVSSGLTSVCSRPGAQPFFPPSVTLLPRLRPLPPRGPLFLSLASSRHRNHSCQCLLTPHKPLQDRTSPSLGGGQAVSERMGDQERWWPHSAEAEGLEERGRLHSQGQGLRPHLGSCAGVGVRHRAGGGGFSWCPVPSHPQAGPGGAAARWKPGPGDRLQLLPHELG